MKPVRESANLPCLLYFIILSLISGAPAPANAQPVVTRNPSLRGAQIPLRLPNGRISRPSTHAFRYLDTIRVRFHDEGNAPNRPLKTPLQKSGSLTAAQTSNELSPITQIVSDRELIQRGVPELKRIYTQKKLGFQIYRLSDPAKRDEAIAHLRQMPEVRYAEPVQRIRLLNLPPPNDSYYGVYDTTSAKLDESHKWLYQWNLPLIHALEAWSVFPNKYFSAADKKKAPGPKIAVIDTGIDYLHPDFVNAGGVAGNNTEPSDVINGGQLDLAEGYDFYYDIDDPADDYGHGTHVSGIIGAATNNGAGIAAIGYPSQIMPLKVTDPTGDGDDIDVINALIWAADHGAMVANLSLALNGGYSQGLQDAIDYCWSKNMLVVAAAGNDGVDYVRRYPAACNKVLAVAASGYADNTGDAYPESPASYTNSGLYVGIAAPGGDASYWNTGELGLPGFNIEAFTLIWSTVPTYFVPAITDLNYTYEQGTSMASPHAAGLAILYAASKGFTQQSADAPRKIVRAIQRGADNFIGRTDGGWHPSGGYGRINALATITDKFGASRNLNDVNPDTPGGVTGQVTYYGTPILNASLKLNAAGRKKYTANSKDDGTYRIPNVVAGTYTLTCKWQNITLNRTIVVENGCDTMATDFALEATPSVAVAVSPKTVNLAWGGSTTFTTTVTGSTNQNVVWSIVSGPGAIDANGKYTAPASGTNATTVMVKAASVADTTKSDTASISLPTIPKTLTFNANPVTGGTVSTGTLKLSDPAPVGGTIVTLTSSNTGVATVPATVTVLANSDTATFSVTTVTVNADTVVNITATGGGLSIVAPLTIKKPVVATAVRINSGGSAYTSAGNAVFLADTYYLSGQTVTRTGITISNSPDPSLYMTLRFDANFGYSIPVPNGTYTVKLHFAETSPPFSGINKRKFNVTMNGTVVYSGLDVFAEAGAANKALIKTNTVTVTNGKLDISFAVTVGTNAFVNAIEVY